MKGQSHTLDNYLPATVTGSVCEKCETETACANPIYTDCFYNLRRIVTVYLLSKEELSMEESMDKNIELEGILLDSGIDVDVGEESNEENHSKKEVVEEQIIQEGAASSQLADRDPLLFTSSSDAQQIITTGLKEFLHKNNTGKEILKAYRKAHENNQPLPGPVRSKLVRLVIGREKDWVLRNVNANEILDKFIITRERFEILANEIAFLFEKESASTYFRGFKIVDSTTLDASGKLWNHFNYLKQRMRNDEMLRKRINENENVIPNILEEDNEKVDWLSKHLEPWQKVKQFWAETFTARRQILSDNEIFNYIEKFPCLKTQAAKELISLDFSKLYPTQKLIDDADWDKVKRCFIDYLKDAKNIKNLEDKALVHSLISGGLNPESQNFIILYLLPYIIPPKRCGKRKSSDDQPHKLSLEERRESFILHCQTANDVQPKLQNLRKRLQRHRQTLQPIVIAVGPVASIDDYYVVINDKFYEVDASLNALYLAFKVFFSFDCKYPENTQTIWVVLQNILINISLPTDVVNVQSNIILGHIKTLLEQ